MASTTQRLTGKIEQGDWARASIANGQSRADALIAARDAYRRDTSAALIRYYESLLALQYDNESARSMSIELETEYAKAVIEFYERASHS